jgi:hypothetical protein
MTNTPRSLFVAAFAASICLNLIACGDPGATYEPRSGTWSYEEEAVVSNTCDDQVASDNPAPGSTTFNLDHDEGDEFQIEQGEEDVLCEIDGETFTCADYTGDTFQVPLLQAFITGSVRWEGEFISETIANGTSTTAITCTGDDCDLIDQLPCARTVSFTAEFVN